MGQLIELILAALASGMGINFNVLRILRLLRVVRLIRAVRFLTELRTLVQSIAGSLKPLFWAAVLLFMLVYVVGICLTQTVHTKRMSLLMDGKERMDALDLYWGTLIRSMFSLFE